MLLRSPGSALPLLVLPILALVAREAVGGACDTLAAEVAYLPPPYTVAALRKAVVPGLSITWRMESPVAGRFHRQVVVLAADQSGVLLRERTVEPPMRERVPGREVSLSWEQLRDYGCFPSQAASRVRDTQNTPFGPLAGWRYEVGGEQLSMSFFFADGYPGLPLSIERHEASARVFASRQILRSDLPENGDLPTPGAAD